MIVAVDGPAASGKGTLARALASRLGFAYLDTGTIYRAVAARLLADGKRPADEPAAVATAETLAAADLERADLRTEEVTEAASIVAAIPAVRRALLAFQRDFARRPPAGAAGAVLDGRDIGTVVCPEAAAKIFVTATPEVRAARRHRELLGLGRASIYARVLRDMEERDRRDESREVAPTRPAEDALVLDTSALAAEEVVRPGARLRPETAGRIGPAVTPRDAGTASRHAGPHFSRPLSCRGGRRGARRSAAAVPRSTSERPPDPTGWPV